MPNALGDDKPLTRCEFDAATLQINDEVPFDDEEKFVVLVVLVPVMFIAHKYAGLARLKWCAGLLFPLAFIWFPKEIGNWTGYFRTSYVNVQTPGGIISFLGWLFLVGVPVLLHFLLRT